jgi:signal recognition particle GTPase
MELKTPIKFIGTGEREVDFAVFDPEIYVESLLS